MARLIVPGVQGVPNSRLTVHDYVRAFLRQMRAPLKESTTFTSAGRTTLHKPGERIIYAPDGTAIRVVELPEGGNQIEHGEHLHAHVRATTATAGGHITH